MKRYIRFLFFIVLISIFISACAARRASSPAPLQCNVYVINQLSKKGIHLPYHNANGLDRYMISSPNWKQIPRLSKKKLDHKEAYKLVRAGKIVIATYNTHSKKSGHIAILANRKIMYWSKSFNAYVPFVDGSINGKPAKITPLSKQFSSDKEINMNYFAYAR